jgi:patatin-related protein
MRSRWFRPPFSGEIFSTLLFDALTAMAAGTRTPPLLPPVQPLDLFVTVTDYHGAPERLHLHSPAEITETEHRLVMDFNDPGADAGCDRHLADIAELAFAARATASFPGAFPPARVDEIDRVVKARGAAWPNRARFLARIFPGRPNPENATLIDGSVLNNRPFGPAIEALARRPAHREVDRRFVYVDPKPGMHAEMPRDAPTVPGFFATVLRSVADIPRHQPIADNLAAIDNLSARIRQLRYVVEGMTPEVDTAIAGALGLRVFLLKLTGERLAEWRSKAQSLAARNAGFAYVAYGQLKVAQIVENLAQRLATLGNVAPEPVRAAIWREIRAHGFDRPVQAQGQAGAVSDYVTFLRSFDLEFRIRRLRFMIRRVNALTEATTDAETRAALDTMKAGLYDIVAPHLQRRRADFFGTAMRAAAAGTARDPAAALASLAAAMDLKQLDADSDAALVRLFGGGLSRTLRRTLISAYLGFPFFDIALLPLLQGETSDEFDDIKVDRLSPDDSLSLRAAGGGQLKGALFNAFGAFFSRAFREHDYLWGRLHGAERLIDIVASALPDDAMLPPATLADLKRRAFVAIVEDERAQLTLVPELFAALDRVLAEDSARA